MDSWTHNKTMFIFIALNGFVTKSYMDMYVSNQWTHGQLDTQQNNVSLFNVSWSNPLLLSNHPIKINGTSKNISSRKRDSQRLSEWETETVGDAFKLTKYLVPPQ